MSAAALQIVCALQVRKARLNARLAGERGEGIISVAVAVLIMAALGVVLWGLFGSTIQNTSQQIDSQVQRIGN